MSAWVVILSGILVFVFGTDDAKSACPERCKCDTERNLVDCRHAGLTRIPWNLPDPSGLNQLDLRGNNIRELMREIVSYKNLQYLDISDNELLRIGDYVLTHLPRLKNLYLKNNALSHISTLTFQSLSSLMVLDLSDNKLDTLGSNVFKDLEELVSLDLSRNAIESIQNDTFSGLVSLKSLNLNSNRLTDVSNEWWSFSPSLDKVLLDMNRISILRSDSFQSTQKVTSLSIEGNGLTVISADIFGKAGAASSPLEELSLKHNRLLKVPSELLTRLQNLQSLDLSQNLFEVIDPDAFKGLDSLETLYLNALPELKVVRAYSFSELLSLRVLQLHSNPQLHMIEASAFLATPNLRSIDIHGNGLSGLNSDLLPWRSLHLLDLRQNPWHCDCTLSFLAEVLRNLLNQSLVEDYKDYILTEVTCASPNTMAGRRLVDLVNDKTTECSKLLTSGVTTETLDAEDSKLSDKVIIAVIGMFVGSFIVCLIVLILRTRRVTFHTKESNRVRRPRRWQRHRQSLASANGTCNHYSTTDDCEKDLPEDRLSIKGNEEEAAEDLDDVFAEDAEISSKRRSNKTDSETTGKRPQSVRKVSFADFVQVRTCPLDDLEVCPV